MSDSSQVSDGAAALIVVSEKGVNDLKIKNDQIVEVLSIYQGTGNLYEDGSLLELESVKEAAKKAYQLAELIPSKINCAEVRV